MILCDVVCEPLNDAIQKFKKKSRQSLIDEFQLHHSKTLSLASIHIQRQCAV